MNTAALGKIFHNGHRPPSVIKLGMRYKQVADLGRTWVVKRKLESKTAYFPHVMIVCEEFEKDTRVIAESALTDTHLFHFVADAPPRTEKLKKPRITAAKTKKKH